MQILVILAVTACAVLAKPTSYYDLCYLKPCGSERTCETYFIGRNVVVKCLCLKSLSELNLYVACDIQCDNTEGCAQHQQCERGWCHKSCDHISCGPGAECQASNHTAVCSCPANMVGDPMVSCQLKQEEEISRVVNPDDVCEPNACGANTDCKVENERPVCTCKPGYKGNPLSSCIHECLSDNDCSTSQNCLDLRCQSVCTSSACGEGANCEVVNQTASCTCLQNYLGDAHTRCYPECKQNADCPDHLECLNLKCADTCKGTCGENADCSMKNHFPICNCRAQMTGDPLVRCFPVEKSN